MHILIATGGSAHSDIAVVQGGYVAAATAAPVTLLTVVDKEGGRAGGATLLRRATTLLPALVMPEKVVRVGQPAEQIVRAARRLQEANGDLLLVLGERPHHALHRHILPPTVERVLQQLPCPLLIAREPVRQPGRLLVCESGREPSLLQRLMSQLQPLLAAADALTVLHVMSQIAAGPGVEGWQLRAGAQELMEEETPEGKVLAEDLKRLQGLPLHLEAKVRHGLVVKEILAEARSGDYDLVVIGAHQRNGWAQFLLDDLAQEIVDHADRPVLVV